MCQHTWLLWVAPVGGGAWQQLQLLCRPCHGHHTLAWCSQRRLAHPVSCQAPTRYPHLVPSPSTARSGPPPWLSSDMCPADPCTAGQGAGVDSPPLSAHLHWCGLRPTANDLLVFATSTSLQLQPDLCCVQRQRQTLYSRVWMKGEPGLHTHPVGGATATAAEHRYLCCARRDGAGNKQIGKGQLRSSRRCHHPALLCSVPVGDARSSDRGHVKASSSCAFNNSVDKRNDGCDCRQCSATNNHSQGLQSEGHPAAPAHIARS